jgi:1,2-phenylacetyl-CoA epoxidase catalytic subunit
MSLAVIRRQATAVKLPAMEAAPVTEETLDEAQAERNAGVLRYYELAKRAEWQVRDLPWGEIAPIPESRGSAEKQARRRDIWRSVIMQQLQADVFACEMASQLLSMAPHVEAKLYYSTMVQDESRHTEAWLKLADAAGGAAERDPHLDKLAAMFLDLDTLEEKVFLMQVFFERMIIPRFRMIAAASPGTVLEDLCKRLTVDDGIHHRAGVAYERVLLEDATRNQKNQLVRIANKMLPIFVDHALWRPKARAFIGALMQRRDAEMLRADLDEGVRLAESLGIDVRDLEMPALS